MSSKDICSRTHIAKKLPLNVLTKRAFGLEKNSLSPSDSMSRLRLGLIGT